MMLSVDAEKLFDKFKNHLLIHDVKKKLLEKIGVENFLNLIKSIYKKSTANIILNSERLSAFSLKSGTRTECSLSSLLFNMMLNSYLVH